MMLIPTFLLLLSSAQTFVKAGNPARDPELFKGRTLIATWTEIRCQLHLLRLWRTCRSYHLLGEQQDGYLLGMDRRNQR